MRQEYTVKAINDYSMHIILKKEDGFKVGDKVVIDVPKPPILSNDDVNLLFTQLKPKIASMIETMIEEAKRGY